MINYGVKIYTLSGSLIKTIGHYFDLPNEGRFVFPIGVFADDKFVYVTDQYRNVVQIFNNVLDDVSVPNNPSNLTLACSTTPNAVSLYWNDYSSNETGYSIYKSTDGVNFTLATTAPANATVCNVTGLTPGQDYWFRIKAFDAASTSPYDQAGPINCSW